MDNEIKIFPVNRSQRSYTNAKLQKDKEYMNYIDNHVKLVQMVVDHMSKNVDFLCNPSKKEEYTKAINIVKDRIKLHDDSKYSEEEFEPYRRKFFPTEDERNNEELQQIIEDNFKQATDHHYKCNSHHPEHWMDEDGSCHDMPLDCILEMIADWNAVSIDKGSNMIDWYMTCDKQFSPKTREIVNEIIITHNYTVEVDKSFKLLPNGRKIKNINMKDNHWLVEDDCIHCSKCNKAYDYHFPEDYMDADYLKLPSKCGICQAEMKFYLLD